MERIERISDNRSSYPRLAICMFSTSSFSPYYPCMQIFYSAKVKAWWSFFHAQIMKYPSHGICSRMVQEKIKPIIITATKSYSLYLETEMNTMRFEYFKL